MPKPTPNSNPVPLPYAPSAAAVARNQARAPPTSNPWNSPHGPSGLRNSVLSNGGSQPAYSRSQVPPTSGTNGFHVRGASQASQMSISGGSLTGPPAPAAIPKCGPKGQQYMNPSVAPSASMISVAPTSVAGSNYRTGGTRSRPRRPRQTHNNVCDLSNWGPSDYRVGEIYWMPYHEPNGDPTVKPTDTHLKQTMAGFVYSKKRMVVVLWTYAEDMFCVPIYSFHGNGLRNKPRAIVPEYVCLQNDDDLNFQKQGVHDPVVAIRKPSRKPFSPESVIHITGGFKVSCTVENNYCGRLSEESYIYLRDLWERSFDKTKNQQY